MKPQALIYAAVIGIMVAGCEKKSFSPTPAPNQESAADTEKNPADDREPDIDLVGMSATIVYSEVFNIMSDPEAYVGKKIRVQGMASSFVDYSTGTDYYSCVIPDATQCCEQGLEYQLEDETAEYPKDNSEIIVTGIFTPYEDDGYTVYALMNANVAY